MSIGSPKAPRSHRTDESWSSRSIACRSVTPTSHLSSVRHSTTLDATATLPFVETLVQAGGYDVEVLPGISDVVEGGQISTEAFLVVSEVRGWCLGAIVRTRELVAEVAEIFFP